MNKPISIIIPVGNDPRIGNCLQSIENQSLNDSLEVILVKSNCEEKIDSIIANYESRIPTISIESTSENIGLLRNIGLAKANSNIYYFVDSDCILKEDSVSKAIESGGENEVTRGYIEFQGNSRISKLDSLLRQQRYSSDLYFAYCPNLVVRKQVFDNVGMFNEEFRYGSDGEFAKRLKDKGVYCSYNPDMRVIHLSPESDSEIIKRWVQYGEGRRRRYKNSHLSEKIKGLFTPVLFDIKKGAGYNVVVGLCMLSRWYGWVKSSICENDK